ncbi:MAG: hypothetical protein ABIK83_13205 [Candidatus Zixiibacteriota bacterium]|nr:hypothetical protein [candidate division Zixibacteria bacterium]MBU1472073.1 hypothetical protein [candidate division Zixibacteria bacterium]
MQDMNEDHERITALKTLVDATANEITSGGLNIDTANRIVAETRIKAAELIPDDMDKYDMIYTSRFERLIEQYITSVQPEE